MAYIGLGSNLQQPAVQVRQAMTELDAIPQSHCSGYSSLYQSPPMGPADQPEYINAVARMVTRLSPIRLLGELQIIEQQHGRVRARPWGQRTLDLDLLLYGEVVITTQHLTVPHPGMAERAFVLYPLQELESGLKIPSIGSVEELIAHCPQAGIRRYEG